MCRMVGYAARRQVGFEDLLGEDLARFIDLSSVHRDGWGIAWSDENRGVRLEKEPKMAKTSRAFELAVKTVCSTSAILHLRQSTRTGNVMENMHPFLGAGVAFAHNGAIEGAERLTTQIAPQTLAQRRGNTDSELMFLALLTAVERLGDVAEAARYVLTTIRSTCANTGLNFLLLTPVALYAACAFNPEAPLLKKEPKYYNLYYRTGRDHIVVASSGWDPAEAWVPLDNGKLLKVDRDTLESTVIDLS